MRPHDDLLESIREELRITPSASFQTDVRARIEAEPAGRFNFRLTLVAPAAAAAVAVAATVGSLRSRDVPAPADPVKLAADVPTPVVTDHQPAVARGPQRSRPAARPAAPPDSVAAFDPFTDVVIDTAEQRGFMRLVTYSGDDPLPSDLKPLSIDEPVQVVALNKPTPLEIPLLDIRRQAGTSDGQTR